MHVETYLQETFLSFVITVFCNLNSSLSEKQELFSYCVLFYNLDELSFRLSAFFEIFLWFL